MATLPRIFENHDAAQPVRRPVAANAGDGNRGGTVLRALPQEDVFFFCKKIDNSRLVREADPKATRASWNIIGAACVAVVAFGMVMAAQVAGTMEGYKLEALRSEEQRLLDERRSLDLQEAQLLSPERLEKLAKGQNLVTPSPNQVFHLETRPDGTVAMVKK
jgi:cell division protein FtsL